MPPSIVGLMMPDLIDFLLRHGLIDYLPPKISWRPKNGPKKDKKHYYHIERTWLTTICANLRPLEF